MTDNCIDVRYDMLHVLLITSLTIFLMTQHFCMTHHTCLNTINPTFLLTGVGAEAVIFAAALSLDRSIFKKTNFVLAYRPRDFNNVVRNSLLGMSAVEKHFILNLNN